MTEETAAQIIQRHQREMDAHIEALQEQIEASRHSFSATLKVSEGQAFADELEMTLDHLRRGDSSWLYVVSSVMNHLPAGIQQLLSDAENGAANGQTPVVLLAKQGGPVAGAGTGSIKRIIAMIDVTDHLR